jgi:hypothetical protein
MKKLILISSIFLAIFLTNGSASAWYGSHFGIFFAPPPLLLPPPPFIYYRGYYPPPRYYGPSDYYYNDPYRVWVPGHWERRWIPYHGWERTWFRGYWRYAP